MTELKFVLADGKLVQIAGQDGYSVMEAAIEHSVPGIDNVCGGNMQCGSCHAYLAADCVDKLPAPAADELTMLEEVLHRRPESRLTRQLKLCSTLGELSFEVPPA